MFIIIQLDSRDLYSNNSDRTVITYRETRSEALELVEQLNDSIVDDNVEYIMEEVGRGLGPGLCLSHKNNFFALAGLSENCETFWAGYLLSWRQAALDEENIKAKVQSFIEQQINIAKYTKHMPLSENAIRECAINIIEQDVDVQIRIVQNMAYNCSIDQFPGTVNDNLRNIIETAQKYVGELKAQKQNADIK